MENRYFSLLFVISAVNSMICGGNAIDKANDLSGYEYGHLEELYKYDSNDLLSPEVEMFIDDYLEVLLKHIKILEQEIVQKKSWFKRSDVKAFFAELKDDAEFKFFFLIYVGIFSFCGGFLMLSVYEEYQQIKLDTFREANIPDWMIKKLRFIRFTRAQKRHLDQRDVNKIYHSSAWNLNRKPYTVQEQEKIKYLGRKLAPLQTISRMCAISAISACVFALAGGILYILTPSIKNGMMKSLSVCLERDKRLLELLKNIKMASV